MKYFLFFLLIFISPLIKSQNFITREGEFMDTTRNVYNNCKESILYYYSLGAKYPMNSNSLLKEVHAFMQTKNNTYSGNGYITFRCRIGCDGKRGNRVQVLQTDELYNSIHFKKELINELYDFFKTMDKWPIGKIKGESISYMTYITFKIKNGKVITIVP
jgi:hypothetical protein